MVYNKVHRSLQDVMRKSILNKIGKKQVNQDRIGNHSRILLYFHRHAELKIFFLFFKISKDLFEEGFQPNFFFFHELLVFNFGEQKKGLVQFGQPLS